MKELQSPTPGMRVTQTQIDHLFDGLLLGEEGSNVDMLNTIRDLAHRGLADYWSARPTAPSEIEPPPGYRVGKRKLIYNKLTKTIDVVTTEGFVVDSFEPPLEEM